MSITLPIVGRMAAPKNRNSIGRAIMHIESNFAFKRKKECLVVYKFDRFSYEFKNDIEKLTKINNVESMLKKLKLNYQIRWIPIVENLREKNMKLMQMAKGPLRENAIVELEEETSILTQHIKEGCDYEVYFIIELDKEKVGFRNASELFSSVFTDPTRLLFELAGTEIPDIPLRVIENYHLVEQNLFHKINRYLKVRRASEAEIEMIDMHPFFFSLANNPPVIPENGQLKSKGTVIKKKVAGVYKEYLRPNQRYYVNLCDTQIDQYYRHLEMQNYVDGKLEKGFQAMLVVSKIDNLVVPGEEFIQNILNSVDFPVSVSIRTEFVSNNDSIMEVNKKKLELKDQEEHKMKTPEAEFTQDDYLAKNQGDDLQNDVKGNKDEALHYTTIVFAIAAKSKKELERRVTSLMTASDVVEIHNPAGDQWALFNDMVLGGEHYASDYIQKFTASVIAASIPGASWQLGDGLGCTIGMTGALQKPVRFAMWRASQINMSPNIAVIGDQGGGKSFAADFIFLKTIKISGAKGLLIDPKGDRKLWEKVFPSFNDQIQVIEFSSKREDKGKLDPFNIRKVKRSDFKTEEEYRDVFRSSMNEASLLALDVINFVLGITRDDTRKSIALDCINEMKKNNDKYSMNEIIRLMDDMGKNDENMIMREHAEIMSRTLRAYSDIPYASLLFGDGDEDTVDFNKQVTVLCIENLTFPDKDTKTADFTESEIISQMCLTTISTYILRFIQDRSNLTIFELDEAKVIKNTAAGATAINQVERMARALNSPGILIGQSPSDLGNSSVYQNIPTKFIFGIKDSDEQDKALSILGINKPKDDEENDAYIYGKNLLGTFETGQCLHQDADGNVGVLMVDAIFDEYIEGLNTKPSSEGLIL